MSKIGKSINIRVSLFVIYLILTGITGITCAQDTIPSLTPADTTIIACDTIQLNNSIAVSNNNSLNIEDSITVSNGNYLHIDDDISVLSGNSSHFEDSIHASTGKDSVRIDANLAVSVVDSISTALDSIFINNDSNYFSNFGDSSGIIISSDKIPGLKNNSTFKPNPKLATRIALIFPGFGQAYNRQYWKLPLVYGGLMGFAYAITWNNKTYQDYKDAYFDIIQDSKNDPKSENPEAWSQSWQDFVRRNDYSSYLHDRNFHNNLKRGKDYFRRYRDLSIILGVAFYFICVADAYVDAQMFDFDISPDLSFRFTPLYVPETITGSRCYGINMCMTF